MADSGDVPDLIRRWKELQLRQRGLTDEVERLIGELEGRAAAAPAATEAAQVTEDEEEDEDAELARYAPPVSMKPHEYVFWVIQTFGVIDYPKLCAYMWKEDGEVTPERKKVIRNILSHLRDAGRVVNVGRNVWKVREVGERKR